MRTSKRLFKGLCVAAMAISLSACEGESSIDFGASGLTDGSGSSTEESGSSGSEGSETSLITPSASNVSVTAQSGSNATAVVNFTVAAEDNLYVKVTESNWIGVKTATAEVTDVTHATVLLSFLSAEELGSGSFSDAIEVKFCVDPACASQLDGSPVMINAAVDSTEIALSGGEPLITKSENRTEYTTDLFAATYVQSAGAFVAAVNSNPTALDNPPQTLIFIDPVTKAKGLVGYLSWPATSIVSDNTGLTPRLAVGHSNGWVTVIDFNKANPSASLSYILFTGYPLGDISLNASDLYAIAAAGNTAGVRRVHLADNTYAEFAGAAAPSGSSVYAHGSGDIVYVASSGVPDVMKRFDVSTGDVNLVGDSGASGIAGHCGGVWSSAHNNVLVSGCGELFSITDNVATDLNHVGTLVQPPSALKDAQEIVWFADSVSNSSEMMTISQRAGGCLGGVMTCPRTLSFFETSGSYNLTTSRMFGSHLSADDEPMRLELPVAAAYSEDGTQLYVLTRLEEMDVANIDVEIAYLHVLNR